MSGNLTAVREMSGILLKVREVSVKKILPGKSGIKQFIVCCIFASIVDFAELVHFVLISNHAVNCQGISHYLESGHAQHLYILLNL